MCPPTWVILATSSTFRGVEAVDPPSRRSFRTPPVHAEAAAPQHTQAARPLLAGELRNGAPDGVLTTAFDANASLALIEQETDA
jgi:hypothetical protein